MSGPPPVLPPPAGPIPDLRTLLAVVMGTVVVATLYLAREVLIPVTLAMLLSFVLAPIVDALRRLHVGRTLAVLLASFLALSAVVVLSVVIGFQLANLADGFPRYATAVEQKVDSARTFALRQLAGAFENVGRVLGPRPVSVGTEGPSSVGPSIPSGEAPPPLPVEVRQPRPSPLEMAARYLSPILNPLATATIVFVVAVFVLLQREDLRDRLIRLAGATDLHRTTTALDDAARRLSRFFLFQLALNTGFGVVIGFGLFVLGVPGWLLWGTLAGLMRYVPFVGGILAALFPLLLAAAVDPGWGTVLWTAALFLVGEAFVGQVVEPVVFGHSTGLSPASVIVAAIFWSWIWGPIGLILAMPLTLCLVVLGRHVERLEFLDVMLGDQPALSPPESFYQRMLAGDPDEALDQAELLLKERSLCSYYDEVALKGLQLAAIDAERGVLPKERLDRVGSAALSVIADLSKYDDARRTDATEKDTDKDTDPNQTPSRTGASQPAKTALPEAWQVERAILCVSGRGPLDQAAAAMLAQLLSNRGIGALVLPHAAVAREQVGSLDTAGVQMVCISYLEISGSPAHLRYLIRRLRGRLPGAPVLVGLWPAGEAVLSDTAMQAAIGADVYTTSLRDAVEACGRAARKSATALPASVSIANQDA
ncbi:AI-2E family transporter [Neoroseomonas rubea]|uniref:AI-2E family transporter n=1 Tax=Neoroseomonas rubea TaxID=2748666 RepID=UPI0018DFED82|nr:AI-2E family transporter [Roseomonas rubea]